MKAPKWVVPTIQSIHTLHTTISYGFACDMDTMDRSSIASLSATLFAVLIFVFGISTARAMPLEPLHAGLLIPVASGCGLGVHRGPLDGCYPVYGYYAGYGGGYRNNYYTGFNSGGVCSGRGTHLACNRYGICWVACS